MRGAIRHVSTSCTPEVCLHWSTIFNDNIAARLYLLNHCNSDIDFLSEFCDKEIHFEWYNFWKHIWQLVYFIIKKKNNQVQH